MARATRLICGLGGGGVFARDFVFFLDSVYSQSEARVDCWVGLCRLRVDARTFLPFLSSGHVCEREAVFELVWGAKQRTKHSIKQTQIVTSLPDT